MNLNNWANSKIKKFTMLDIGILKICVIGFALMMVKLIPQILILEWYWYGVIFIVSYIYILIKIFKK